MKFAEAALFRVAVSPGGKIRDGIRQGRADARFVRGVWLGKTTESDQHVFANELGVYTTRTVRRVPDTEQKRADLVKGLQGTPRNWLAGRAAGRPCKTAPDATPVATPPVAKETERPSEDADERRSTKAEDFSPPAVPHVIRVLRAKDNENEPSSPWRPKMGALETTQPATVRRSDRQLQLRAVRTVHFASFVDFCHLKNSDQKYKGTSCTPRGTL